VKRRLFHLVILVGLLICVAIAALWIRSTSTCDTIARGELNDAGYSLSTFPGGAEVTATGGLSGAWFGIWKSGWHVSSYDWGTPRFHFAMSNRSLNLGFGLATWTNPSHYLLGFGHELITLSTSFSPKTLTTHSMTRLAVPFWFLMLLAASPGLLWLNRWRRHRVRRRQQRCVQCGYDLRASPDRCPECGLVAKGEVSLP